MGRQGPDLHESSACLLQGQETLVGAERASVVLRL